MRRGLKSSLLLLTFLLSFAFCGLTARPAHALVVTDPGAYVKMAINTVEQQIQGALTRAWNQLIALGKGFLGIEGEKLALGKDDNGADIVVPAPGTTYTSATEFETKVRMPWELAMQKQIAKTNMQAQVVLAEQQNRIATAGKMVDFTQDLNKENVRRAERTIGLVDQSCPYPSMTQSAAAATELSDQHARAIMRGLLNCRNGAADCPDFAKGPALHHRAVVTKRSKMNACDPTGNDGADSAWCKTSGGTSEMVNRDQSPDAITGVRAYVNDDNTKADGTFNANASAPQSANSIQFARANINLKFPQAFTPIRSDLLDTPEKMDPGAAQLMSERSTFLARQGDFMAPPVREMADRIPLSGLAAATPLKAVFTRAGFSDDMIERYMPGGNISRATMDYARYKVYIEDPQTVVTQLASGAALNLENIVTFSATMDMNQVSLLYDIRETIKQTNLLLASLGAVLQDPSYRDLEARSSALGSNPGRVVTGGTP